MSSISLHHRLCTASLLVGCALFGPLAAAAPDATDAPSITVSYADLDVARDAGARSLYARLRQAARHVCSAHDGRELQGRLERRRCIGTALDGAVRSAGIDKVTALHRARAITLAAR